MLQPRSVWEVPGIAPHAAPIPLYTDVGAFVFFSAIRGLDHSEGRVPDDPPEQARLLFANFHTLLVSAGLDWPNVVKVGIYMSDLNTDRALFNEHWRQAYPADYSPARFGIQASDLGVPGDGTRFVVDAVAMRAD